MKVVIPLKLTGSLNSREHWAVRAKRVKRERNIVALYLPAKWRTPVVFPVRVTLTRLAPRQLDDDNLAGRLKGVRDEVAAWLGLDDRDSRVTWAYAQGKSPAPKQHWVSIEVAP